MRKGQLTNLDFEIINVEPVTKYISECEIKVMYHGENRNGSYISKEVATKMANSLPNAPIVAVYNEETDDFEGHGREVVIADGEVQFKNKTVPYGGIHKDSPIVWQKYLDHDGEVREYLVAKGYLWTGRYPELKGILENSKGQSMELYEESIKGEWAKSPKGDYDIFIYSEADISALCILGDEVEPCFEGGSIHSPELTFSLEDKDFQAELERFHTELDKVVYEEERENEGGDRMDKELDKAIDAVKKAEETKEPADIDEAKALVAKLEDGEEKKKLEDRISAIAKEEPKEEKEEDKEEAPEKFDTEESEETEVEADEEEEDKEEEAEKESEKEISSDDDDGAKKKKEFAKLKSEHAELLEKFNKLQEEFSILKQEKDEREMKEKEELCNNFSALSEEVMTEIKSNLASFSIDELEKELAAAAFKEGLTFSKSKDREVGIVTHKPSGDFSKNEPDWAKAIRTIETTR